MSICENCYNYILQEYFCDAPLDQDEMGGFYSEKIKTCPYFRLDDEYSIVRKQN